MKQSIVKNQSGAVLAFSLVMLLLLTLVGASMIQQNKAQIGITGNAGQQTKTFSAVEAALAAAQTLINNKRYVDLVTVPNPYKCKSADQINQGDSFTDLGDGATGTVEAVYCISEYSETTKSGNEFQCLYSSNGSGNRIITVGGTTPAPNVKVASPANVEACKMLNAAGSAYGSIPKACQIEEYTLNVTLTDSLTGAKRTVESKFEVDCSGDLNPP